MSFGSEPRDHHVHDVGSGVEVVVPGVLGDQRPRHDAPLVAHQVFEDCVLLRRQIDGLAAALHLAAPGVERQVGDVQHRRSDGLGAASQRFHPRQQLLQGERLGDVVVGAHAQRLHFVIHAVLRRQDEHRHRDPAIAQRPQQFAPLEFGKPQVEHEQVVVAVGGEVQPLLAVAGGVDVVARLLEAAFDVLGDRLVVLDHQNLHPTGRNTLKLEPTPTCDSTSMRPRWSVTMP